MRARGEEGFFFNDTAATEIYTLSLHDALPIYRSMTDLSLPVSVVTVDLEAGESIPLRDWPVHQAIQAGLSIPGLAPPYRRSEEHTSELQSRQYLVCRLLLEKKKHTSAYHIPHL